MKPCSLVFAEDLNYNLVKDVLMQAGAVLVKIKVDKPAWIK